MTPERQQQLVRAYATTSRGIRAGVVAALLELFRSLGSWRSADVPRFTTSAVPMVIGGQQQLWSLTDAYLTTMLSEMGGRPRPLRGTPPRTGEQLRGVAPEEEYTRPFRTIWAELEEQPFEVALERGLRRLQDLVATDLQLAKTHAAQDLLDDDDSVHGYRRVLVGSTSCGLCVVASTQRYHRHELLPIHPGCDCGVAPIVGDQDPGQVINEGRLEDVHAAIEQRFGVSDRGGRDPIDYRNVLVVHEHGEIGPVLARAGHEFTGPGDIPAT